MPLAVVTFIVFLILKLVEVITWSWWWVTSPLWIFGIIWVFWVVNVTTALVRKLDSTRESNLT